MMHQDSNTKRNIFMASAELFAQRSYARVSVRDIAAKVGIKPASIYYHYKSKAEIFEDIVAYYCKTTQNFFNRAQAELQQAERMPHISDIFYLYSEEERKLMYWITRIIFMEQFTSPLAADALIGGSQQRYLAGYRGFFQVLAERGIIKKKENCEMYAELFARMGHAFQLDFIHPEFEPKVKDSFEMYRFLLQIILGYEGTGEYYKDLV